MIIVIIITIIINNSSNDNKQSDKKNKNKDNNYDDNNGKKQIINRISFIYHIHYFSFYPEKVFLPFSKFKPLKAWEYNQQQGLRPTCL